MTAEARLSAVRYNLDLLAGNFGNPRCGNAEVFVQLGCRCRGAEAGHADETILVAQPLVPALGDRGFDATRAATPRTPC